MCEPENGGSLGTLLAVLVAVVLAVWVLSAVLPVIEAVALSIPVACVSGSWAVVRLIRYGAVREVFRRHPARPPRMPAPQVKAITTGQAVLEPARPRVYVITDVRERTGHDRVL